MPTLRKVAPEVARTWGTRQQSGVSHLPQHYAWAAHPAKLFLTPRTRPLHETPKIGDVLSMRVAEAVPMTETTGVVLSVRLGIGGAWAEVELARCDGVTLWVVRPMIAVHLGRVKGVSRIDQPNKYIHGRVHGGMHGWFVRVYRGTKPYLTATFSDATAGSMRTALKAALAIHTAYADLSPDQGLPFD